MRQKLFLSVALSLVCLFAARAQTVIENESSIVFVEKTANVSIALENSERGFDGRIQLELLDTQDKIRAQATQNLNIKRGRETYKIALPIGDLLTAAEDEIAWFRLRYSVGKAEGFISLSELIKDIFELRVAAAEKVFLGTNYRARVRAVQPFTNAPVKNVKIEGELTLEIDTDADEDEIKLKAKAETDGEGFAVLDFKIPENVRLDDIGDFKITGRKNGIVREYEDDGDLELPDRQGSLFLTADKPIYQPGQSFNVRALYFDVNQTVVAGAELEFTVKDEDDTALYRETVKTSAFGIASISWKIPENAKLGAYRVEVEADEDEVDGNEMYFKVSRYDLPQFSVSVKPDKTFYLPNQTNAEITVSADYLFGKPVTKGKVRVVQESDRRWNWQAQKYDVEEKQAFEGEADAEGKYVAKVDLGDEFKDLMNSGWKRFDDLHFAAYFTDLTTNRTEQRRFDVRLTKEPIHVYLIRKNYDDLSHKLPVTAYISTFYADGAPAVCDVMVEGKNNDDDKDFFKIFQTLKTNSLGAGKIEFLRPASWDASDDLDLKITARDAKGQTGTFEDEISYYDETDGVKIETEKTIFRPGEPVKIKILSSVKDAVVYLDIVKNRSVLESRFVRLKDGKAEVKIPYNPAFKGDLTVSAYFEDKNEERYYGYDLVKDARGIIFPEQQNLRLNAEFTAATYKPGEEAKARFSVFDGAGKPVESALGVVVFDKAVEERAKTDAEFGSYFSRFRGWLGYEKSFGGITLKDLNELDLSKPISAETQLAAEVMLANNYYYPRIYRSENWETNAQSVYADFFKKQLTTIENVLKQQFEKDYAHPTDEASLRKILSANGVNFDSLRDPWGNVYQAVFTTEKTQNIVTLKTAGADKKAGTKDDFAVSSASFAYFTPVGKAIDKAAADYYGRTEGFIRDWQTLSAELAKQDVDLNQIKDRWNRDYRITFEVAGRNYLIRVYSVGANGVYEPTYYNRDDFEVWKTATDYFAEIDFAVNKIFSQTVNGGRREFPRDDAEFKQILKENGLDLSQVKDGYGQPVYLTFEKTPRYSDKMTVENGKQKITPVTEEVLTFRIRSVGANSNNGADDFDLTSVSGVVSEQSKDTKYETKDVKTIAFSGASGAIRGTVFDPNGAVVPGATITATNEEDETKVYTATSKDDGTFLLQNIPSGRYKVKIESLGFSSSFYENIQVRSQTLVEIRATLSVGVAEAVVDVSSEAEVTVNASSSQIQTTVSINGTRTTNKNIKIVTKSGSRDEVITSEATSTPRLREYFPETLFWSPEIITGKDGRAEAKFKMADNITTWKLYTVASTKNGKIGVAEREVTAFQPFFVDLEPPKFLTDGDEIHLPTQVRNYTESKQKVGVTMERADWFTLLSPEKQTIEVASNASENAVFGFKATQVIKDGKQRVTAIAAKDSDAIEKPVTVRPNGQEIVRAETKLFNGSAAFDVEFPQNALPKTPRAELKIYPNLMAHVTESVEGLLQRPYGCGEQTISSTYPNLMILKFKAGAANSALEQKARKYLQKGYERLLGYQVADGGFSYWGGKSESDIALTAYALRFLSDAEDFIETDAKVIENARNYLIKQQRADGGFTKKYYWETSENSSRTKLLTSYVARTLAAVKAEKNVLDKALAYLKTRNAEIDEPYALALYGLASLDAGNTETARETAQLLEKMAIDEGDRVYWNLETNTPFYGWGTAGRIETTALVLQLLIKTKDQNPKTEDLISRATMFLLKAKDRYGVWYSTQTTINVLDAFLASLTPAKGRSATISVSINGEKLKDIAVQAEQIEPVVLDLTGKLTNANRIEITSSDNSKVMSQIVQTHYIDWKDAEISNRNINDSRAVRLDYKCDKQTAKIMETVTCAVEAERVGFKGYGMLLAEIGLPPGADVSRESLQAAMDADWSLSRYDVLPDRIILYMWSKAGGTRFNFSFKPRYGINANTPASVVYDYYNEEAKGTVAPLRFEVK